MNTVVMTLAFQRHTFIRDAMEVFQANSSPGEYDRHVLWDVGYPIPSVEENSEGLRELCREMGIEYGRVENRGCHLNWDTFAKLYAWGEDDVLVGVCGDTRCHQPGWITATKRVMQGDDDCFTVQLNRRGDYSPYPHEFKFVGGVEVVHFENLVAWSCGSFRMRHVKAIGGFSAYNKVYGYGEHYLVDKLAPMGKRWYFLRDFYDDGVGSPDAIYTEWKIQSAGGVTELRFEEWIKLRVKDGR